jgi:hypothetical protein
MKISRRYFLGAAAGSAATLWSFRPIGLDESGFLPERDFDCTLLDLHAHCVLRESLRGYQAALGGKYRHVLEAGLNSKRFCRMAIVPGLGSLEPVVAETLSGLLESGTHVLLESGAGFFGAAEFTAHQNMLYRYFNIEVAPPVDLWSGKSADDAFLSGRSGPPPRTKQPDRLESLPYIGYSWPRETQVRDFSRAIPVSAGEGEVIGKAGALPVALKRRTVGGRLIFLGSPLGPALLAGDLQARSWLRLVTALVTGPRSLLD